MLKTNFNKVQDFNRAFDMVAKNPKNYNSSYIFSLDKLNEKICYEFMYVRPELFKNQPKTIKLRLELIKEEIEELKHAIEINDFIEIRDALADILYVVYGMADVIGIDIDYYFKKMLNNDVKTKLVDNINNQFIMELFNLDNPEQPNQPLKHTQNNNILFISNFKLINFIMDRHPDKFTEINNYFNDVSTNYKLSIIETNITNSYNELEYYCINGLKNLKDDNTFEPDFNILAKYISLLLKWVYIYSYISNINSDNDFNIVHNSNMSKLCDTEDDAIETVEDYMNKYINGKSVYDTPYYYALPEINKWIVKNKSTGKALKNIKYCKVDFTNN